MTLSSEGGWDVAGILSRGKEHLLCECYCNVTTLVPGSQIRRAGVKGKRKWAQHWKDTQKGFDCDENFIRVYVAKEHVLQLTELIAVHNSKYEDAGLTPTKNIGTLDVQSLFEVMYVIDGMHRTVTLTEAHYEWLQKDSSRDPKESPYLRVRAYIYHPEVKAMMAFLAKASNDQKQLHVGEDGLERITLTQKALETYRAQNVNGTASFTAIAKWYMSECGCKNEKAVNYMSQLVSMAVSLEGPVTLWITEQMEALEQQDTGRAEVRSHHTHSYTYVGI